MSDIDYWNGRDAGNLAIRIFGSIAVLVVAWMGLTPWYNVFHQRMEGEAMLAKAEFSKKVLVQDALAREESAKSLAQAEITRAEGVAKANKIIGESLKNNPDYLSYLWLHNLEAGDHDVIYVATEAGMPIMEAGSRMTPRVSRRPRAGDPGSAEHPDVLPGAEQIGAGGEGKSND